MHSRPTRRPTRAVPLLALTLGADTLSGGPGNNVVRQD